MALIDKETIRKEIERRMEEYNCTIEKYSSKKKSMKAERDAWKWAECKSLLNFLDTLPEQPVEGLEEAAKKHIQSVVDAAGHPGWDWETQDIVDAFIAGAEWQRRG